MRKEDFIDIVDLDCLGSVAKLLEDYPVEQVQACVNYLVSDSVWLQRHRDKKPTVHDHLIGPYGRIGKVLA